MPNNISSKCNTHLQCGTFSLILLFPIIGHAGSENTEIKQLQEEVKKLRQIMEQQVAVSQKEIRFDNSSDVAKHTDKINTNNKTVTTRAGSEIQVYGFLRADAAYQFYGGNSIFNHINKVDLEDNTIHKDQLYTTVTTTRIGLDFKKPSTDYILTGKLEMDFRGGTGADTARIRHAYLNYNNWLIGKTTSNFHAPEYTPEIVDFGSPIGIGTFRTPILRYNNKISTDVEYSVALEQGRSSNRLPTLTTKAKYNFVNGKGNTSLRGMLQELRDYNTHQKETSWGTSIGVNYQVLKNLNFKANYTHMKGDDTYMLFTNSAFNVTTSNQLNLNEFESFVLGATYQVSPKLRSTLGYGAMFSDKDNTFEDEIIFKNNNSQNKKLQQGWLNIMYSPIKPLTFGIEYIYGERQTYLNQQGKDSRIESMVRYSF